MNFGFLLDENLPVWWRPTITRLQPHLRVLCVGEPGVPPLRSPDPVLLAWCELNTSYLLTNNRRSMPGHLAAHNAQGHHVPGIFSVDPRLDITDLANELALIEGASLPDEYQDQIRNLPLT
ncbi:MAG TPA: hypothetical protein VKA46_14510 [Gemmataceae bacterium]|nr:hypothetical protein [Gemmataceae bacterium]